MKAFIQKNAMDIYNAVGGGIVGFISSRIFQDWIQPLIVTFLCAIISLLVSHFGKKLLDKK